MPTASHHGFSDSLDSKGSPVLSLAHPHALERAATITMGDSDHSSYGGFSDDDDTNVMYRWQKKAEQPLPPITLGMRMIKKQLWCCCLNNGIVTYDLNVQPQRTIPCRGVGGVFDVAAMSNGDLVLATNKGLYESDPRASLFYGQLDDGPFTSVVVHEDVVYAAHSSNEIRVYETRKNKWTKTLSFKQSDRQRNFITLHISNNKLKCCSRGEHVIRVFTLSGDLLETFGSYGKDEPLKQAPMRIYPEEEVEDEEEEEEEESDEEEIADTVRWEDPLSRSNTYSVASKGSKKSNTVRSRAALATIPGSDHTESVQGNSSETTLDTSEPTEELTKPDPGQMISPYICCDYDEHGSIVIADCYNNRLQVMTEEGDFMSIPFQSELWEPNRAVFYDNALYVTSGKDKSIVVYILAEYTPLSAMSEYLQTRGSCGNIVTRRTSSGTMQTILKRTTSSGNVEHLLLKKTGGKIQEVLLKKESKPTTTESVETGSTTTSG